jgi:hypothetical protein
MTPLPTRQNRSKPSKVEWPVNRRAPPTPLSESVLASLRKRNPTTASSTASIDSFNTFLCSSSHLYPLPSEESQLSLRALSPCRGSSKAVPDRSDTQVVLHSTLGPPNLHAPASLKKSSINQLFEATPPLWSSKYLSVLRST